MDIVSCFCSAMESQARVNEFNSLVFGTQPQSVMIYFLIQSDQGACHKKSEDLYLGDVALSDCTVVMKE